MGRHLLIVGGVIANHILEQAHDIVVCDLGDEACELVTALYDPRVLDEQSVPRPLLIGSSVVVLESEGEVVINGGGSTMFSFGSFWTSGTYAFAPPFKKALPILDRPLAMPATDWGYCQTIDVSHARDSSPCHNNAAPVPVPIRRIKLKSRNDFDKVVRDGKPVVLEGLNIGKCVSSWDFEYLTNKIGNRKVTSRTLFRATYNNGD